MSRSLHQLVRPYTYLEGEELVEWRVQSPSPRAVILPGKPAARLLAECCQASFPWRALATDDLLWLCFYGVLNGLPGLYLL